jgi:SPP1 family phage portal protein
VLQKLKKLYYAFRGLDLSMKMTIQDYIDLNHRGSTLWFVEEVKSANNWSRVMNILNHKEYLSGQHKINTRPNEKYNGKEYEPRKIVLQYVKTILNFETSYLLQNPVTLSGDEGIVDKYKRVYRRGKYSKIDADILDNLVKYGNAYEYVYVNEKGNIVSRLIAPEDAYPVFNHQNEMIAFIEYYNVDNYNYYNVFYGDVVESWTDVHGGIRLVQQAKSVSGMPIMYKNMNELDPNFGRSDIEDVKSIIDNMEDLLSKFADSFYKHHNPIPVLIGQQLKGDGIPKDIVGAGLVLDDNADFKMIGNQLDYHSFETLYKTLKQALLDVSNTPAVSLNNTDISNLSEVSIKLLFSLADIKAGLNERYMREGMEQRFEKIANILNMVGEAVDEDEFDSLNVVFQYSRPQNEKDIIENLKLLQEMGAVSLETILEKSPYITDVTQEMERLKGQEKVVQESDESDAEVDPNEGGNSDEE